MTDWPKTILDPIFDEIEAERREQNMLWGGAEKDDKRTSHDWVAFLTKHVGKTVMWPFELSQFRKQMVRVAALAVAAIEWCDRLKEREDSTEFDRYGQHGGGGRGI